MLLQHDSFCYDWGIESLEDKMDKIIEIYGQIYSDMDGVDQSQLGTFLTELKEIKDYKFQQVNVTDSDWYKDAVVYSLYVDLFNKDMGGLESKLDDLAELGVTCLWLLPILESPMKDAGFDISDYEKVRPDLLGQEGEEAFDKLIESAHKKGIRIIFDIAMNHCSIEHPWFQAARQSKDSKYRDYFIWNDDEARYEDARIIFKGMCDSNWAYDKLAGQYFFHRFFEIQPDLNYRNPDVLLSMVKTLVQWKIRGIDGFRADAVPYIWKEENTICENLPKTHLVVKFMRAVMDYLSPGTLMLAEACQPPIEVVTYFGQGDECQGAYHFPVMPRIYGALAEESAKPIISALDPTFTPDIPDSCQWFMFLRCHDELTLEMVTPEERKFIYDYYVKDRRWDFREGEGISSRLANLFNFDARRILQANAIMMSLPGTPIIYYGDEYGKGNDHDYYDKTSLETGYPDSRYLVRGPMDWSAIAEEMSNAESLAYKLYNGLKEMLEVRKSYKAFSRGGLEFVAIDSVGSNKECILSFYRSYEDIKILCLYNLSAEPILVSIGDHLIKKSILNHRECKKGQLKLMAYDTIWLELE